MNESSEAQGTVEALRREAEFGRSILQRVAEGLCVCHEMAEFPFVRFTVWNEAMERITGYAMEEINRRGWYQTLYPDPEVQARAVARMERMRHGDDLVDEDWEITRADGVRRQIRISTSVVSHGEADHVLAVVQDVTDRKRAEVTREVLLFLEADLGETRSPVEAARVVFAAADKLWTWDSGFLNMYSAGGELFDEVLDVDVMDGTRKEVPLAGRTRKTTDFMRRVLSGAGVLMLRKPGVPSEDDLVRFGDGTRASASLMFVPMRWHGEPVGILSVQSYAAEAFGDEDLRTLKGLADHCGGALRRIQAVESLRASEADLHRAQAVARTGSWYLDLQESRLTWSAETRRIFGFPDRVPGSLEEFLGFVHPEDRESLVRAWNGAIRGEEAYDTEHRIVVQGEIRWVRERAEVSFDERGVALRAVGTVQDVTERKRAEERREQLEGQLRQAQKMESVGHLAGGVAHDFNNILAAIVMNLGLIREELGPSSHVRELLDDADQQAQRAASLVRQLLLFARREVMSVRCLDLETLLDRLLLMLRRLIGAPFELARAGGHGPSWIEADAGMIEQAVTNLVLNARDAMPEGGRISVRTECLTLESAESMRHPDARPGRFVRLTVSDDGVGMSESTLRHLFEPFFTTKEVGQGTGLGLSTVYGIVRQHRGWVDVESVLGRGSSFHVYLPGAPETARQIGSSAVGRGEGVTAKAGTILVVDDEPAVAQAVVRVLERHGYRTLQARDGWKALELAVSESGPIDVLLTDLVMPGGLGGVELAARLREVRPGVPVVIMSGYQTDRKAGEDAATPGVLFLQKPFVPAVLLDALRECLAPRQPHGTAGGATA